jgi:large repetitive protein
MRRGVKIRLAVALVAVVGVAVPGALLSFSQADASAPPTVTAVSPDVGPLTGGTVVTVTGTNFISGLTTVSFGYNAATDVVVDSSTTLTAVAPAESNHSVDVIVTTAGQTSTTSLNDLFAFGVPTVTGLTPSGGPAAGGTSVIINGTSFVPGLTVAFGGTPATGVIMHTGTSITAEAPPGTSGWVDVSVTTAAGTSATTSLDRYAYDVPSVEWISPNTGGLPGGTPVTIVGSGFTLGATVDFGSVPATSVVVRSTTALTATSPPGVSGSVDVTVTTSKGISAAGAGDLFAYGGPPVVSIVGPNTGPVTGGTAVVVAGTGFTGSTGVDFGVLPATAVTVTSPTTLTAIAPAQGAGSVDITLTTSEGTSAPTPDDLFAYGAPAVSAISPAVGTLGGGTGVTITGTGFAPGATVFFGGTAATGVSVTSATSITAVSPPGLAGPVNVSVITPAGNSLPVGADVFTYGDLEVTSVSPTGGPIAVGTPVTITGTGFVSGASVQFGGFAATDVAVTSANTITATSPAEPAGVVDVTVTQGVATSPTSPADLFTFGAPSVSAVLPTAGPLVGGEVVDIAGSGFVPGSTVEFGSVPSPQITVQSDTLITAVAPAAAAGMVDITVTTPAGASAPTAADQFTTDAVPTVSGVNVDGGPRSGGTPVNISGTGFVAGATVMFGNVAATGVTVTSPTSITATSPAQFSHSVDVTVTTPGGVSAPGVADLFAYGTPSVWSVEPDGGDVSGGAFVAVTGFGFVPGATVTFGSTPATDVTVLSATQLTAVSPAHVSGSVDVQVTTREGTSPATTTDLFSYGPPTISSLSPNTGPVTGGTLVTITGTGFTPDATVVFVRSPAASVDVVSGTEIVATTPTGVGSVDVIVQTPDGDSIPSPSSIFIFGGPAITSITPDSGPLTGGTYVTITGSLFTPDTTVQFGSTPADSVTYVSPSSVVALAPTLPAGSVNVTVTNSVATSPITVDDLFASGPPTVSTIEPDGGPITGGTTVTITGNGFVPDAAVNFGFFPALDVTVDSGTQITATAPAQAAGSKDVTVTNGQGTSAKNSGDLFIYGAPTVVAVSPSSGPINGGTIVTVNGTGFTSDATVSFGYQAASSVAVQSSTSLTVVAPPGTAGVVDIFVFTPGGHSSASAADEFAYNSQLEISCTAPPYATTTAVCPGINLPAVSLNGNWQSAQASGNTMYITDNRGESSAGWSVSAYLMPTPTNPNPWCAGIASFCDATAGSDSAYPDAKIPSSYLSIGNVSCTPAAGNPSPDPQTGAGGTFPDGSGAVSLCTAQAGQSAGTFKLGETYSLAIPPWVYAGQYQATIEYLAM